MFAHLFYLWTVILVFCLNSKNYAVNGSLSGLYIDNGIGQTVMSESIPQDDIQEMKYEISEALGLPSRFRHNHIHPSLRKSAPQFLLDVYKQLNTEDHEMASRRYTRSTDNHGLHHFISAENAKYIEESDSMMTFSNKRNHKSIAGYGNGTKLWFDIAAVSKESSLMMATLQVYKKQLAEDLNDHYVITVYAVTQLNGEKGLVQVTTTNTTADYEGWLELNVTDPLEKWILNNENNHGLYITVNDNDSEQIKAEYETSNLLSLNDDEHQPFVIGYFQGENMVHPIEHKKRIKRSLPRNRRRSKPKNPLIDNVTYGNRKSCQMHTLYVSFKDLNWNDWILAPEGYNAFYCHGECNFPLNAHMNATNHAVVQTLVHLMQPSKVPKPCCIPTKLSLISVLYFINETDVNLKKYRNIVARRCGCH